ncbi:MAG: SLC13 family permease [Candidatus Kapabacteria bacterium]|nr:SLC13 family permease [Candidatus Kapabacteria bacterium]
MPKLLIIDDEKDFLESITKRLEMRNYKVISKDSGKDIEQLIKQEKDIDVVILDLKMPDIPGEEVLKRIKSQKPNIQVIILTGHGSTESAVEMAKLDAFTYLQKPAEIDKLIKIIDDARAKAKLLISEHEEVTKETTWKKTLLLFSISVLAGVIVYLLPLGGISERAQIFLALLTTVVLLWVTEAVPIGATAFIAGGGLVLLGIQKPAQAWEPFANPAVMFVMMIIMFGVILNEVGIAKRILYYSIKIAGTNVLKFSLVVALTSSITSAVFHDATITIIFLFAVIPVFFKMGITVDKTNNFAKFFTIMIPLTASAGGFGTILGGGRNPIALEFIEKHIGVHIGFLDWIIMMMPMVIVSSLATWAVCWLMMPPRVKEFPAEIKAEKMPPMTRNEKGVSIIFVLAIIFWTLSDLTKLHVSVVAAIALIAIFSFKFVTIKTVIQKFSWEAWLVFGAGVSLGIAMLDTGAGKWLAEQFFPLIKGQGHFVTYYSIAIFASIITSFMSNSAATALCLPILDPLAIDIGLNRVFTALSLPVTTSFVMLVIGCPPSIISYSTGYFSQMDFIKVAIPKTLILCALMVILMEFYWPIIFKILGYAI